MNKGINCRSQLRQKEVLMMFFLIGTIVALGLWRIDEQLAPIILMDEFGYWSNAAFMTGRDWSQIAQYNAYYSYGYSVFLAIIMLLFSSTALSYPVAILLNCCFLCITFLLLIKIGEFLFPNVSKSWVIVASYIAIIYPTYCANMHIAWAESLLVLMFALCVYALIILMRTPNILTTGFFAVAIFYCYTVHQRAIGVLVAGVLIFFIMYINKNIEKKHMLAFCGIMVILFIVHGGVKNAILQKLLISAINDKATINDYTSIWEHIVYWFNLEGLKKMIASCIGKFYYLQISSYGLFSVGLFYIVKKSFVKNEIEDKKITIEQIVYFFMGLSFLAIFMTASIFTLDAMRLDGLVYGRYTEWALAPIILVALLEIDKKDTKIYISNIVLTMLLTWILWSIYKDHPEWTQFFAICSLIMAMYTALTQCVGYQFIFYSCIWVLIIMFLITLCLQIKHKNKRIAIAGILILLFTLSGYWCTSRVFESNYRSSAVETIYECISENKDKDVYYVMDEGQTIWYVADLQVMDINREIKEVSLEQLAGVKGYVLIGTGNSYLTSRDYSEEIQIQDGGITLLYLNEKN